MRRIRGDLVLALLIFGAHAMAVWGYTGVFWGDIGRWSHEVERFALGELPYRDFQWHFPPLALWVTGGATRFLGTERAQLSLITTALATLLVVAFVLYARRVLERADALLVATCLILAVTYAQTAGAPLPLGLYSPALLVGALCIAVASLFFVKSLSDDAGSSVHWMALFAGLAVLSKHDFWIPAAYLVGVTTLRTRTVGPPLISALVTALGVAIIVSTAGVGILLPLVGGFGHVEVGGGRGFPSWERLCVELFVLALLVGALVVLTRIASRRLHARVLVAAALVVLVSGGIHVGMSMQTVLPEAGVLRTPTQDALVYQLSRGEPLLRPAIGWLRERAAQAPIPVLLAPLLLLVTAWRWKRLPQPRRRVIAFLLGLCVTLRARRAFEGTEWIEFLLTLPVLVASAELLLAFPEQQMRRMRLATIGLLAMLAVMAYPAMGRGVGTRRHYPEAFITARGAVRWKPSEVQDYRRVKQAIDAIDPTGRHPVFAFGFSGGFNYFLRRPNPFPFTQNFFFSAFDADSVLQWRPPDLILIDNPVFTGSSYGAARFSWRRWEQERVAGPFDWYDRPRFERLRAGCAAVPIEGSMFKLYACPGSKDALPL